MLFHMLKHRNKNPIFHPLKGVVPFKPWTFSIRDYPSDIFAKGLVIHQKRLDLCFASSLKSLTQKMLDFAPFLQCKFAMLKPLLCKLAVQV